MSNLFPGLVSSEIFNMGNGMDMHVEKKKLYRGTRLFHPAAGTLVFVLDGNLNLNHLGSGRLMKMENIGFKNLTGFMVENRAPIW
ncbi:MAG: hypothetical protein CM15mP108_1040 [Gammaproteobacteria bacterium]|nr:MAG: hypothetical protein CM15mP108_1040 [Gammaproteobacteria bacterium]